LGFTSAAEPSRGAACGGAFLRLFAIGLGDGRLACIGDDGCDFALAIDPPDAVLVSGIGLLRQAALDERVDRAGETSAGHPDAGRRRQDAAVGTLGSNRQQDIVKVAELGRLGVCSSGAAPVPSPTTHSPAGRPVGGSSRLRAGRAS